MQSLNTFLVSTTPDISILPVVKCIQNPLLARKMIQDGYLLFVEAYKEVSGCVYDPINLYGFPGTLIKRSVGEVETLLGIDY